MKKTKFSLVLALCACVSITISPLFVGCKTPQQRQEVMGTMILVSAAGMQAYVSVALPNCKGDAVCEDKIVQRYAVYTNAVNAAWTAYNNYEQYGTNRPVLLGLITAMTAAQSDVVKAILEARK